MSTRNLLANVDLTNVPRDYCWYSITTLFNSEESYIRNLKDVISGNGLDNYVKEYFVPIQYVKDTRTNKIRKNKGPYARYVFVKCIMTSRIWNILRTTKGVAVVLTTSGVPTCVSDEEINRIRNQYQPQGLTHEEYAPIREELRREYKCDVVKPELCESDFNTDFTT